METRCSDLLADAKPRQATCRTYDASGISSTRAISSQRAADLSDTQVSLTIHRAVHRNAPILRLVLRSLQKIRQPRLHTPTLTEHALILRSQRPLREDGFREIDCWAGF
jgi:hypothetical protein